MAEDMFAQKGWICPKCGRVLAPSTMYCLWCCNDMKETITTTTATPTTIPKWNTTPITVGRGMIDSSGKTDCDKHCIQTEVGCEHTDCAWKKGANE